MKDELVSTHTERANGSLIVYLRGEIDLSNAQELRHQLENALEGSPRVVIDFSEIAYLDSQGLRLIKQLVNKVAGEGTQLLQLVAAPGSFSRSVLEMAQMRDYVELHDALDD